jgi:hypothetical protein
MTTDSFPSHFRSINRRQFLLTAMGTLAATTAAAQAEEPQPAAPAAVSMGPPQKRRPRWDIEARNVGLITTWRSELSPLENEARNAELLSEIRAQRFGVLHLRGRYIENFDSPCAKPTEEHSYLVFGNDDDSGNLKGFLRKYGRKLDQDGVIHKGYYRDVHLHALRDLPALGMNNGDAKSLGRFHPNRLGLLHTLMTRAGRAAPVAPFDALGSGPGQVDWLGGRWDDIGLWTPKSYFNRVEQRVTFEATDWRDGRSDLGADQDITRTKFSRMTARSLTRSSAKRGGSIPPSSQRCPQPPVLRKSSQRPTSGSTCNSRSPDCALSRNPGNPPA